MRVGRQNVTISNPEKMFFPLPGLTKGDFVGVLPQHSTDCVIPTFGGGRFT